MLACFTFGLYSVVGRYEFTALDDTDYVTENADVMAGKDPQLERAIKIALEELAKNPPAEPKRPPYPDRAKP